MAKEQEQEQLTSDMDFAYAVIDAVVEAMDRVTAEPILAKKFVFDLLKGMPTFIDALMIMTKPEHRMKMGELVKASSRMGGEWVKKEKT